MANGSLHKLSVIPESVWGTTPATPNLVTQRITGTTLGLSKATLESAEIRADRQIAAIKHGTRQVGGDINGELSYETWDLFFEALLGGTWDEDAPSPGTDQLKAGLARRSFTMLREFGDLTAGDPFYLYTGVEINSMSMEVTPENIVTVSWGVLGKDQVTNPTAPTGTTYTEANTNKVIDAFTGSLEEGGAPIAVITAINLTLENGMEPRFVVGSQVSIRPSIGRFKVSGEITAYFEDSALLSKFIDETDTSIDLTLQDVAGNAYRLYLPKLVLTGGQPDVTTEGPITLSMGFTATYDTVNASNVVIERTAA